MPGAGTTAYQVPGPHELEAHIGRVLPDLIEPGVRLLFVAISPGLWSVAVQAPFAHPANRFWPALFAARIVDRPIRVAGGMTEADRDYITDRGIGITSLIPAATPAADITATQLRAARRRLPELVTKFGPNVVAICGLDSYAVAFGCRESIVPGRQSRRIAEAELWVLPNPAVTNPNASIAELAVAYRAAALAAGVLTVRGTPGPPTKQEP